MGSVIKILIIIVLAIVFILIIYVVIRILFYPVPCQHELHYGIEQYSLIPRVIYTFWHDEKLPVTVQKCIASWRKYNPEYEIVILNDKNYIDYIGVDVTQFRHCDCPQRKADFIRLYVLEQNSGVWMDASIYLNHSLDWIHAYQKKEGSEMIVYYLDAFTTNPNYKVMENWFIAACPGSQFIKHWREEFCSINNYPTIKAYLDNISQHTDLQKIHAREYLCMHCSGQAVLQRPHTNYNISFICAEDTAFYYNKVLDWWMFLLPIYKYKKSFKTSIVKFRGGERVIIEKLSSIGYNII